jgi:hypothetical protein
VIPEPAFNDRSTGGLLTFNVAAPVVVICCEGKAALIGTAGFLIGVIFWPLPSRPRSAASFFAKCSFIRMRKHNQEFERDDQSERQTS